jgi:peptidoglycan/LPS O-acetylase OafA/YrhL
LVTLGDSSYSLYMIHPIVAPGLCLIIVRYLSNSFYLTAAIAFVSCVASAHLMYLQVEKPLNARAGKLLGNRIKPLAPVQA